MGIRSAARYLASRKAVERFGETRVWAVEPGWLENTPMSKEVLDRMKDGTSPHRIPGGRVGGMDPRVVAEIIYGGVFSMSDGYEYNGLTIRIDGGEQ